MGQYRTGKCAKFVRRENKDVQSHHEQTYKAGSQTNCRFITIYEVVTCLLKFQHTMPLLTSPFSSFFSSSVRALWIVPRLCILIFPPSREKLFVWERTSEIIHHSKQKDNLCFISDPPCRVECCHISVWDYTPPSAPPVCPPTIISKEKHPIALKAFSSRPRLCFVHFSWLWNVYIFKDYSLKALQNEGV